MTKIYYDSLQQIYKRKAEELVNNLSSSDIETANQAKEQLNTLLVHSKNNKLGKQSTKEVLDLFAKTYSLNSFKEVKKIIKNPITLSDANQAKILWFNKYSEAVIFFENHGGYLFPLDKRYILCKEDFIKALGLDVGDEDWKKIQCNWVYPKDPEAHFRLFEKLLKQQC